MVFFIVWFDIHPDQITGRRGEVSINISERQCVQASGFTLSASPVRVSAQKLLLISLRKHRFTQAVVGFHPGFVMGRRAVPSARIKTAIQTLPDPYNTRPFLSGIFAYTTENHRKHPVILTVRYRT
ncbi:protein of unknown function [Pararobbsia alpina]